MKKTRFLPLAGAALLLAGCGNASAQLSYRNDVVAKVGSHTITEGDLYQSMKKNYIPEQTLLMIFQKIYENELDMDEIKEKAQEQYDSVVKESLEKSYGSAEKAFQMLGMKDEAEYIEKSVMPSYAQEALTRKYFDDDKTEFLSDYKPVKAQIFETTDQDKASEALDKLKDGEDFKSVCKSLGDTTTYDGSEQIVHTETGLPAAVITKLNAQEEDNTLIKEIIPDATTGKYYVVKLITKNYDKIADDIKDSLADNSNITKAANVYYLKKYNFTVYDVDVFDMLKTSYPQYLIQRPDLSQDSSSAS